MFAAFIPVFLEEKRNVPLKKGRVIVIIGFLQGGKE